MESHGGYRRGSTRVWRTIVVPPDSEAEFPLVGVSDASMPPSVATSPTSLTPGRKTRDASGQDSACAAVDGSGLFDPCHSATTILGLGGQPECQASVALAPVSCGHEKQYLVTWNFHMTARGKVSRPYRSCLCSRLLSVRLGRAGDKKAHF